MTRQKPARTLLFLLLAFISRPSCAAVSEWTDFELVNGHITLPVTLNGRPAKVLLDTGSTIHGINQALIDAAPSGFETGRKMKIEGIFDEEIRQTYNDIQVELWGTGFELDEVVGMNLGHADLLLGKAFFDPFIFQIDYPNSRMRLLTRDAIDLRKLKNVRAKIDRATGMPISKINLNGEEDVWLLFDTGANSGVVTKRLIAEEHNWLERFKTSENLSYGVNSQGATETFQLPIVTVGPFDLENVIVSVPREGESIRRLGSQKATTGSNMRGTRVSGLLGYDILKHFLLTIDYRRGHVHLGIPGE